MARKRNEATVAAVQKAAREIMLEVGYDAASYTAIADRAHVARTTVQHYFPAKESFATEIMVRIAGVSARRAAEMAPVGASPFVVYYLTAQIAYGIFYQTEGTRRFLADLCASRDLQHAVAPDYIADGLAALSLGEPSDDDLFDLNYAIGGVYEMHYLFLRKGKMPDLARLLSGVMYVFGRMANMTWEQVDGILARYAIGEDMLFAIGRELMEQLD